MSDADAHTMLHLFLDKDGDGIVTANDMNAVFGGQFGMSQAEVAEMMGGADSLDASAFKTMMDGLKPKFPIKEILDSFEVFEASDGKIHGKQLADTIGRMADNEGYGGPPLLSKKAVLHFAEVTNYNGDGSFPYRQDLEWWISGEGLSTTANDPPEDGEGCAQPYHAREGKLR